MELLFLELITGVSLAGESLLICTLHFFLCVYYNLIQCLIQCLLLIIFPVTWKFPVSES